MVEGGADEDGAVADEGLRPVANVGGADSGGKNRQLDGVPPNRRSCVPAIEDLAKKWN